MLKRNDAYLVGYYGMKNSGDDALMYANAWGAKNLLDCEDVTISAYSESNGQYWDSHKQNLFCQQKFPGQNRIIHYKHAIQSKRIIFGGGSVLHSETDINLKRHLMKICGGNKNIAIGVGVGPFQSIAAEKACTHFLNECNFVGVRDTTSYNVAKSIAPNANIKQTFDLAPILLKSHSKKTLNNQRSGIALSLCSVATNPMGDLDTTAEQKRIDMFCQLIIKLYQRTGERITLIEFNGHHKLGDWQINNPIFERLKKRIPITISTYNPDALSVMQQLESYQVIISMRLHGSILGYLTNTPVISLNYHEKCAGWCEQIGMAQTYQWDLNDICIDTLVDSVEQGLASTFTRPSLTTNQALTLALSNWSTSHE